jgi:hypothetical protein
MNSARDAFGRLIVDPDELSYRERVDIARRLAGELQAENSIERRWFARNLTEALMSGRDLMASLGLRPPRGSRQTPAALIRAEQQDIALCRLSTAAGSDVSAARMLQGKEDVPARARAIVAELRAMGAPTSLRAIRRAKSARHKR